MQGFRPVESELTVGDKIMWTVNDRKRGLLNGMKAKVINIDHHNDEVRLAFTNGNVHTMSLTEQKNQHWTHDYVSTAHASQGMTADRVIYHAESFRRNLASQKAFYVAISRAKHQAIVYTDNQDELISQLQENAGEKQNAKDYEYDLSMSM